MASMIRFVETHSNERIPHMALTSLPPLSLLPIEMLKRLNRMAVNAPASYRQSDSTEVAVACLKKRCLSQVLKA